MIVCSCLGVNDATIRGTVLGGASEVEDVTSMCGAGGDCASCHVTIEAILAEAAVEVRRVSAA